jgi:cytochrome c
MIALAAVVIAGAAFVRQSAGVQGQVPAPVPTPFGLGRPAPAMLIAAWNIDVRPDGAGLPAGGGTVTQGRMVYGAKCASCHGGTGREGGEGPILVDTRPFRPGIPPTIGNYWPYATTVWDYINRTMPFDEPGSLTADEVYALVAFLLNENGIIAEDAVMDAQTLPRVTMPNVNGFLTPDPRPDVP